MGKILQVDAYGRPVYKNNKLVFARSIDPCCCQAAVNLNPCLDICCQSWMVMTSKVPPTYEIDDDGIATLGLSDYGDNVEQYIFGPFSCPNDNPFSRSSITSPWRLIAPFLNSVLATFDAVTMTQCPAEGYAMRLATDNYTFITASDANEYLLGLIYCVDGFDVTTGSGTVKVVGFTGRFDLVNPDSLALFTVWDETLTWDGGQNGFVNSDAISIETESGWLNVYNANQCELYYSAPERGWFLYLAGYGGYAVWFKSGITGYLGTYVLVTNRLEMIRCPILLTVTTP